MGVTCFTGPFKWGTKIFRRLQRLPISLYSLKLWSGPFKHFGPPEGWGGGEGMGGWGGDGMG